MILLLMIVDVNAINLADVVADVVDDIVDDIVDDVVDVVVEDNDNVDDDNDDNDIKSYYRWRTAATAVLNVL